MPVAKLSREFYERFGDKVTDELVGCLNSIETSYRAELHDLFEAHFGRFEEKLERYVADTRAQLRHFEAETRTQLGHFEERLEHHMAETRTQLGHGLAESRGELRTALRSDVAQLRVELHAFKAEWLVWNLVFWVPVALALIGLYART
jgi:hypothetical protein